MELKEYNEISEAMESAENDTTPFTIVANGEVNVVGDANKTELNKHDYTITFRFFKDGKYQRVKQEFKDVYITPRNDVKVNRMLVQMFPYFKKVDGEEIKKYSTTETLDILANDSLMDSMYDTVAAVLSIPNNLKELMEPDDVIRAARQIMKDYPEAVNEADAFFDKSSKGTE